MKYLLPIICFLLSTCIYAQKVNNYKYVIVPDKYDAFKKADQHQLNALSKFLLNKYGFEAYLESDKKPFLMKDDACNALYADVLNDSNFLKTRVAFCLKDCEGNIIFKTTQGSSKKKDYKPAYHEALREAFVDIEDLQYEYNGVKEPTAVEMTGIKDSKDRNESVKMPLNSKKTGPITITDTLHESSSSKDFTQSVREKSQVIYPKNKEVVDQIIYTSEDGFYKAIREGETITFKEDTVSIGKITLSNSNTFSIETSQFKGIGYFKEGRLIIDRKIKGVVGTVQMIFTKQ